MKLLHVYHFEFSNGAPLEIGNHLYHFILASRCGITTALSAAESDQSPILSATLGLHVSTARQHP